MATWSDRERDAEGIIVASLIGFAIPFILVLTWSPTGVHSFGARAVREYAIPVLGAEGVVIGLALISGLMAWLRSHRVPRFVTGALIGWTVTAWATACFVAPRPDIAIFLTAVWMLHGFFAVSVAFMVATKVIRTSALATAAMTGFVVYAVLLAIFGLQLEDPARYDWITALPGLGNLRRVAAYASALIPLGLGVLAIRSNRAILPFVAACAGFFLAFWTGSRGTPIAVVVALVVTIILFRQVRAWRLLLPAALAAAIGLALAIVFPVNLGGNSPARFHQDTTDSGRFLIWRESVDAVQASPLFGYGEGQTALVLPSDPTGREFHAHPHNLLLQWLMAWGVIGATCLATLAIWLGITLVRSASQESLPFLFAATALLVHSMYDGALYDVAPVFLFAAWVGAAGGLAIPVRACRQTK